MPGINCEYIQSYDEKGLNLNKLFGFYNAEVESNIQYLGLLPEKSAKGLIFPNGKLDGVWSSEELKFAKDNGYKIKVVQDYQFNRVSKVFDEYVLELSKLKDTLKDSSRQIFKSLLNNLLGRWGMNILKPITQIVNIHKFFGLYYFIFNRINLI